jgi:hypothetical protein
MQGLERDVEIDIELMNNLRTLDDLVYEVQLTNTDITSLEQLKTLDQVCCQPHTHTCTGTLYRYIFLEL